MLFAYERPLCAKSGHSPNVGGSMPTRINFVLKSGLNSGALNFAVTPLLKSIQGRFIANLEVILRQTIKCRCVVMRCMTKRELETPSCRFQKRGVGLP